ncbi:MAG TPA: CPBP family intramembrane glutamic endopeptidase [Acidobacteriaceae bacterium]|jgi:hypothetical protein|nr:CPBP family intramembrane glutamic endopeptidase [Acidobacteriaceae bacterium]
MTPQPAANRARAPHDALAAQTAPVDETLTIHLLPAHAATPSVPLLLYRVLLAAEFLFLFITLPLLLFFHWDTAVPPLPALWIVAVYCLIILLRDPTFDRHQLWNAAAFRKQLPQMLGLFLAGTAVIAALVHAYAPNLFLILPRTHTRAWLIVLALYTTISVYPQSLIYRAFLFHRYRPLLPSNPRPLDPRTRSLILILVSGATFALVHILFHNWIAVALTFPGGILFARRYDDTRSLALSSFEHALYGCFLFTIGLGQFFYVRVV